MGQSLSLLPREGSLAMDRTGRCQTGEIITGNETINWDGNLAGEGITVADTYGKINAIMQCSPFFVSLSFLTVLIGLIKVITSSHKLYLCSIVRVSWTEHYHLEKNSCYLVLVVIVIYSTSFFPEIFQEKT